MITVFAGYVPGRMIEVNLEDGATVEDALYEAELDDTGREVRVGKDKVSKDYELSDGERIYLLTKEKYA